MKVNKVNNQINRPKSQKLKAARNGALFTAGALTASSGISWATRLQAMTRVVQEYGGTANYLKAYASGLVILSALGAITNTIVTSIANKISPKKPPKAAN